MAEDLKRVPLFSGLSERQLRQLAKGFSERRVPVGAVPGGPPTNDNVQWLGPHGTIVLYPVRGDELINVVCLYDDEGSRFSLVLRKTSGAAAFAE